MDPRRLSATGHTNGGDVSPSETQTSFISSRSGTSANKLPLQGRTPPQTWLNAHSDIDVDLETGTAHPGTSTVPLSNLSRTSPGRTSFDSDGDDDNSSEEEWNSTHPCFPHRNPHVLPNSPEYESTRIIRIARDYMYSGDISPAFSNIYPEILEDRLSEECFRDVVRRVNSELYKAHSPWGFANILEGLVGMLTLWLYEDVISTTAKRRIDALDRYIDKANAELNEEGLGVKIIPLRRTGYLNLDIQIPDPQVREDDPRSEDGNGGREVSEEEQARIERHTVGMNPIERPPAVMVNGHIM